MCPFINLSKEAYTPKDFGTDAGLSGTGQRTSHECAGDGKWKLDLAYAFGRGNDRDCRETISHDQETGLGKVVEKLSETFSGSCFFLYLLFASLQFLLFSCKITKKYLKHNDLLAKVTNF